MVVAIGNPFGLEGTLTLGVVSGLGRTMQSLHSTEDGGAFTAGDIIQTDTAINPGNSGGPLLNLKGEVIGINQAIRTNTFATSGEPVNSGIGFAIPINIVRRVAPAIIQTGFYDYPYLGLYSISDLSLLDQEALNLPRSTGVYVTQVVTGGPAERAGLRGGRSNSNPSNLPSAGDLIIAVDNRPVLTFNDLIGYVAQNKSPGDVITLTVLRGDEQIDLNLLLDKRPGR
jgi:2-alkenal reductase